MAETSPPPYEPAVRSPVLCEPIGARYQDEDGWNGPRSVATTTAARETVSHLYVIPCNDGGLIVELHAGGMEVEVSIDPDGRITLVMAGPPETPSPSSDSASTAPERVHG